VKNSALASAGAELRLINGVSLLAKFDAEFANGAQTYPQLPAVFFVFILIIRGVPVNLSTSEYTFI
jgi:hypothetical protein